jgi:hypothetical protein
MGEKDLYFRIGGDENARSAASELDYGQVGNHLEGSRIAGAEAGPRLLHDHLAAFLDLGRHGVDIAGESGFCNADRRHLFDRPWGQEQRGAHPAGQTLGQTANFLQTAKETHVSPGFAAHSRSDWKSHQLRAGKGSEIATAVRVPTTHGERILWGKAWDRQRISCKRRRKFMSVPGLRRIHAPTGNRITGAWGREAHD